MENRLDLTDIVILRVLHKHSSIPAVSFIYKKLQSIGYGYGVEALRKRLNRMAAQGYLNKTTGSNPVFYELSEKGKAAIARFLNLKDFI